MSDTINVFIGSSADGKRILTSLEHIMATLDDIKGDLAATKDDLEAIKDAVTKTVSDLHAQVVTLEATIADLKAGDALEQTQIDALATSSAAVKVAADETLAIVTPKA